MTSHNTNGTRSTAQVTVYVCNTANSSMRLASNKTLSGAVGNTKVESNNSINVFPNPTEDLVNIIFDKPGTATVTIMDLLGQEIYKKNITEEDKQLHINPHGKI